MAIRIAYRKQRPFKELSETLDINFVKYNLVKEKALSDSTFVVLIQSKALQSLSNNFVRFKENRFT